MAQNHEVARKMYDQFRAAPMSSRIRATFERLVSEGDCDGILQQLETFIDRRPDVGQAVRQAGLVSFESGYPNVKSIWEAWKSGSVDQ